MKAKDTENRIEGLTRHLLFLVEEVQHLGAEATGLGPGAALVCTATQSSTDASGRAAPPGGNSACGATCTGLGVVVGISALVCPAVSPRAGVPPAVEGSAASAPPPPVVLTLETLLRPLRAQAAVAREFLEQDRKAVHRGISYLDFPGSDRMEKRINFAMFRRGRHPFNPQCRDLVGRPLKAKLHKLAEKNRINGSKHKGTKRPRWGD